MIYLIYQFRDDLFSPDGVLWKISNVFFYQTARAGAAAITAFLLSLLLGDRVIRKLISLKLGQPIRSAEEVHKLAELHGGKAGTPTMGGVLLIGTTVVSTVLWARPSALFVWVVLFVIITHAALGFIDDYAKISAGNSKGISARMKLLCQGIIAIAAGSFLLYSGYSGEFMRPLYVPFLKDPVMADMGLFGILFFFIVIVGASNAVNLTDGLDGLATGCSLTVAAAYAMFAYIVGHREFSEYLFFPRHPDVGELTVVCFAFMGSALGFLWFNCHPARVFMGDTGSLAIGAMFGIIAIICRQELLLVIVGGVFVMEALSVIIQVGSFKLRGKRVFKMAPIHHHFELMGWKEGQVIVRFWILSVIFALIGLATLKLR